jgi:hypothetical protein
MNCTSFSLFCKIVRHSYLAKFGPLISNIRSWSSIPWNGPRWFDFWLSKASKRKISKSNFNKCIRMGSWNWAAKTGDDLTWRGESTLDVWKICQEWSFWRDQQDVQRVAIHLLQNIIMATNDLQNDSSSDSPWKFEAKKIQVKMDPAQIWREPWRRKVSQVRGVIANLGRKSTQRCYQILHWRWIIVPLRGPWIQSINTLWRWNSWKLENKKRHEKHSVSFS